MPVVKRVVTVVVIVIIAGIISIIIAVPIPVIISAIIAVPVIPGMPVTTPSPSVSKTGIIISVPIIIGTIIIGWPPPAIT